MHLNGKFSDDNRNRYSYVTFYVLASLLRILQDSVKVKEGRLATGAAFPAPEGSFFFL